MAHVLIIDDDAVLRETLASALSQAGHVVRQAANGAEGVRLFRAAPADLVLTDIVMPEREGLETIMSLRRDFPGLRVIAMSGLSQNSPHYLDLAKKLGARRTLAKPFSLEELLRLMAEVLAEPGAGGAPGPA